MSGSSSDRDGDSSNHKKEQQKNKKRCKKNKPRQQQKISSGLKYSGFQNQSAIVTCAECDKSVFDAKASITGFLFCQGCRKICATKESAPKTDEDIGAEVSDLLAARLCN